MSRWNVWLFTVAAVLLCGCATYDRHGLSPEQAHALQSQSRAASFQPSPELKQRILALNAEQVTETDLRETLAFAPAPRVISIHGGIAPVQNSMISFGDFLIRMGYPAASITNEADGTYTFSCYEDADMIAGMIAWYYERDGLRPMMVGHSQGGMQAIKVLYRFADEKKLAVWNPLTWKKEKRHEITDPLTGQTRPVVGLTVPYVSAVGSGGPTRLLPSQWEMNGKLRAIPDTVLDFTGFCKGRDLLGGEFLGYGSANEYYAKGTARVRNVWLPSAYKHGKVPDTRHLAESAAVRAWLNQYRPPDLPVNTPTLDTTFDEAINTDNILWAADVWYSVKKHWVLELQRLVQSKDHQP